MTKFLTKASYTPAGVAALHKVGGTSRKKAIETMVASMGGSVEAFYFSATELEVYVIVELPDSITAAAMVLSINSSGLVSITNTMLLAPEDIDKAAQMSFNYLSPGS